MSNFLFILKGKGKYKFFVKENEYSVKGNKQIKETEKKKWKIRNENIIYEINAYK